MKKSYVTTILLLGALSLGVVAYGRGPADRAPQLRAAAGVASPAQNTPQPASETQTATGRLTSLGVSEKGGYHAIVRLDSAPKTALTIPLNGNGQQAMFSLLREAFVRNMTVEISSKSYPKRSDNTITQVSFKR